MEENRTNGIAGLNEVKALKDEGNLLYKAQEYAAALAKYFAVSSIPD